MIGTQEVVYENDDKSFRKLQEFLGKRPGNYRIDPFYVRQGMAHKPYFWDDYNRKWVLIKLGDRFRIDEYGIAVKVDA